MEKKAFIIDDKRTIDEDDVAAFQSADRYVAKGRASGFVDRIVRGKINVYRSVTTGFNDIGKGGSQNSTSAAYYVQKGIDGEILTMTPKVLKEMMKDNEAAAVKANKLGSVVVNVPKMESAIKFYNEN